ncbi:MAG: thiamine pyrophosphate-dependent enzyme [Candidatus Heimdallarchaeaceae archaeon]
MNKQELIDFESKIATRFDNGEIPYLVHLSGGNEEQLIEVFEYINKGDYVFSTHRSHYHYLLAGGDPDRLEDLIVNGKSMFVFDRELNFYSSSIVCATPSIAAGVAWALKRKNSDKKVWCFVGDGAEDEGHLYEAARYVESWNLPCMFVIEDNDRSVSAGKEERWGNSNTKRLDDLFECVIRYEYESTYPHGGTSTAGWLTFKNEQKIEPNPEKQEIKFPDDLLDVDMKFGEAVKASMEELGEDPNTIFVGYNVRHGSAYGMLKDVPIEQRLETPLAENLMAGLCIGMSMEGFRPILFFERHDFIYNALDAIVNQIDKIGVISQGIYKFPVIIKAVVGGRKPFYAGITHTSNIYPFLKDLLHFPVCEPKTASEVLYAYRYAVENNIPVLISELKELY